MLTQASRSIFVFVMLLAFPSIEAQEIPKGIMPKRALVGTGGSPSSSPVKTTSPTTNNNKQTSTTPDQSSTKVVRTTNTPTSIRVTTTNADGSRTTKEISTNTVVKQTTKVKNSFVTGDKTTVNAATLKHKTVISEALVSSKTLKRTYTSSYTSNGSVYRTVVTTNVVVPTTTGFAKTTVAPSLANGSGSGGGLSGNTKAVVGGVVGGIGGAALVGGIAFVLWRLWNKKKQEDQYESYSDKHSSNRESNMTFGSEGYGSTYGGRMNPASNF